MKSVIIKPKTEILNKYVQYFLFFKKTDSNFLRYTTFPNNNLCLAIYKENDINYINHLDNNKCTITKGEKNFTTKLYGFHKMPFTVNIDSSLDQICILFYPSALKVFTNESYSNLIHSNNFFDIFSNSDNTVFEQIFEESEFSKKADKLEELLLNNLNFKIPNKLNEALHIIETYKNTNFTVEILAKKLSISTSSLFRLFKNYVGQNPKSYLKTIRFRHALNEILKNQNSMTSIAHLNQYYDQAHFINDFKSLSGYSPSQLNTKISVQQSNLVWIYNKK